MNIRIPLVLLIGSFASGMALSDPTGSRGDAQVQAATLLVAPMMAGPARRRTPPTQARLRGASGISAQNQAARLLQPDQFFEARRVWPVDGAAAAGAHLQDAQAQAQRLLRVESPSIDKAGRVRVSAVAR